MKKLVVILFGLLLLTISCDKHEVWYDVSLKMEEYYTESLALQSVIIDSVLLFDNKVDDYTRAYPLALKHRRYPLIKENIKAASVRISIKIDTAWGGGDYNQVLNMISKLIGVVNQHCRDNCPDNVG